MNDINGPMYYRIIFAAGIALLAVLGESTAYRRYVGLSRWQSILMSLVASGIGVALGLIISDRWRHASFYEYPGWQRPWPSPEVIVLAASILPLFAVPFGARLYCKYIRGNLTDAEKQPGFEGLRAWFAPGNIICAVSIPVLAWLAFGLPLPSMFAVTVGLLLAYPLFNLVSAAPEPVPVTPAEDLSHERERVLRLLEMGKITADESAELLNALGQTLPARAPVSVDMDLSPQRKVVLLGAALLLAGFFLPWFSINPGEMMAEMTAKLRLNLNQVVPANAMPGNSQPVMNFVPSTGTVQVHAGDVAHGLGWWVLALGIGAAVLPFFATNLKPQMQKKVILAALAVGVFLMIYLLSDGIRYASIGVALALIGYILEGLGTLKERAVAR